MRPTRTNVLSDPLYRVKRDKHWFVQRYPHADVTSMAANELLLDAFESSLKWAKRDGFRDFLVAETTLESLLSALLLDFKAPRETAVWYGHLVALSDERVTAPNQKVLVVKLASKADPRERSTDEKTSAITLHQGRSSAKKDPQGGDKELVEEGTITLQIHWVRVLPPKKAEQGSDFIERTLRALALYVPREHDSIAQSQDYEDEDVA